MTRRLTVLVIALGLILPFTSGLAEDAPLQVAKDDTIRSVLVRQTDQRVTLRLVSGEEMTGRLRSVGEHVVHLSELTGKEYYEAVVDLDKVAAVLIRVRGK